MLRRCSNVSSARRDRGDAKGPQVPVSAAPVLLVRGPRAAEIVQSAQLYTRHLPGGLFPRSGAGFVARWHRAFTDTQSACAATVVG